MWGYNIEKIRVFNILIYQTQYLIFRFFFQILRFSLWLLWHFWAKKLLIKTPKPQYFSIGQRIGKVNFRGIQGLKSADINFILQPNKPLKFPPAVSLAAITQYAINWLIITLLSSHIITFCLISFWTVHPLKIYF